MTDLEKSYLAGIIDGEGTITLSKAGEFRYPVITFCNNDINIINYVNLFCKGVITCKRSTHPNWNDNYVWTLTRTKALNVIIDILPYMHEQSKIDRCNSIITNYKRLTPRNGKYTIELKAERYEWEKSFLSI